MASISTRLLGWATAAAFVAAATVGGGCQKSQSTASSGPAGAGASTAAGAKKTFTIGMSQCNLGEPWRVQMNADVKAAAEKHPELKVVFKDAQNDTLRQRAHVEEFVGSKVDVLIISPKDTCFIGADNRKIGKAAGQWIVKKLGGKGNVVELKGLMTSTPGQDRHEGFVEGIKGSEIKVVFDADMKWLEPGARKEMESALARFEKIDLVYAHNDPGAHGAYLAAKAAGREKAIMFVGIDALPQEGVAYVSQGILSATFQYPTGGTEAIDTALNIFAGKTVDKKITLGSRVFTKENVAAGGEALQ
jgi:ribose transport system substrate-binding protein